jgi:hypothetical protein
MDAKAAEVEGKVKSRNAKDAKDRKGTTKNNDDKKTDKNSFLS